MERKREGEGGYFEGGWRGRGKTDLERGYDITESEWVGPLAPCPPVSGR